MGRISYPQRAKTRESRAIKSLAECRDATLRGKRNRVSKQWSDRPSLHGTIDSAPHSQCRLQPCHTPPPIRVVLSRIKKIFAFSIYDLRPMFLQILKLPAEQNKSGSLATSVMNSMFLPASSPSRHATETQTVGVKQETEPASAERPPSGQGSLASFPAARFHLNR